jgi:hypothetical protein
MARTKIKLGIRKGARVGVTGYGRTAKWPKTMEGTVLQRRGNYAFVKWDGS